MIKIALKHFIYDACINVLFSSIEKNFVSISRDLFSAKRGDKFKRITAYGDIDMGDGRRKNYYNFIDCVIISATKHSLDFSGYYVEGEKQSKYIFIRYWAIASYQK